MLTSAIFIKQAASSWKAVQTEHEEGVLCAVLEVCTEVLPRTECVQGRERGPGLDRLPLGTGCQPLPAGRLPIHRERDEGEKVPMPSLPSPSKRHTCLQTDEPLLHYHLGQDMFTSDIGLKRC